jgi:hypothetical protein
MKLKTIVLGASCAICGIAAGLSYPTSDWNPNGYGNWSDATRWMSGSPLPTEQEKSVLITGADAFATDDDYAIVNGLRRLRFSRVASLDLRFNEDHTDFNLNSVQNLAASDISKMIKSGTGLLVDSTPDAKFDISDYVVTNGILKIASNPGGVKFGVYSPGVLVFNQNSSIGGLEGDGLVTNVVTRQIFFTGGTRANPIVFDGVLGAYADPSFNAGCQWFTTLDCNSSRTVLIYDGFVGVRRFGSASGVGGSLGSAESFCWFQGSGGIVYIGDGETTAKKFNIGNNCLSATFDAGAKGDVTFSGEWFAKECPRMYLLNLEGSNTVRCVFSGAVTGNSTNGAMVVKRGSGTWQFSDRTRDYISTVTVEDGTLEYGSMAEAGTTCSLGKSERLYADVTGLRKNLTPVPWAFRLGTHSTTGEFVYVGSSDVACTSRLFAVRGTGIVRSDTSAALSYEGATSYDAQGGTLILEGSGEYDNFANVTNGVGPLSVVKRGSGTWMLGKNIDVAGITVKNGTLRISNSRQYRWYRYTVKQLWRTGVDSQLQLSQFGLFNASGTQQNVGLTESELAIGKTYLLNAGECGWNHARSYNQGRSIVNLFKGIDTDGLMTAYRYNTTSKAPAIDKPEYWISFTMRVADDADTVKYYDVKSQQGYKSDGMYEREPQVWMFEGSVDGRNWEVLDEEADQTVAGTGARWYSSGVKTFNASAPGFEIATEAPARTVRVGSVSVEGGTLVADVPVAVSNLVVDAMSGGTLDGFAFAESGTLTVKNLPEGNEMVALPGTYENCTGLDSVSRWTLSLGGESTRKRISVSDGVIRIYSPGAVFLVR